MERRGLSVNEAMLAILEQLQHRNRELKAESDTARAVNLSLNPQGPLEAGEEALAEVLQVTYALQESKARFRAIFEDAAIGIALTDMDGWLVETNPALQKMHGYSGQELRGMTFADVTHPDDVDMDVHLFEELVAGKRDYYQMEKRYIRKDGQILWGRLTVSLVRSPHGEPQYAIGMLEDITERKRVEEALRESEQRYRSLFDRVPVGLYRSTPDGRILDANRAMVRILGYPDRKSLLAVNAYDLYVNPEDRRRWLALMDETETVSGYEVQVRRYDGRVIWEKDSARIVRDCDGHVLCYEGAMEDITERVRAEQAVRRYAEELEALRRVSLEITAHLDLDTVLHSIVSQAMQLLKGDIGSIFLFQADRDVLQLELVIGIDRPLVKKPVLQRGEGLAGKVWETGQPVIVDDYHRWEGRLGTYQEYSFTAVVGVPIYLGSPDTDGEFLGVVNVLADPPRTFSQADAELLSLFAAQAAIAIQNARLFEQARHEIAERRRAEQALRESEETARALLNTPTHVAALIDTKGFILDANEAMAQRFERQVHEFIGVNGWDLLPPHLAEKRKAFVDQVIQSGKPCRFEDEHGGTWFDNVFYPIHDAQGKVAKIAVLAGDITERKRAEEALRKAHDELEVRVQERTAELAKANEQLQAEIAVRARMAQALREHAEQLEALRQVGLELAAELDLESLLHSIVSRAIGLLGGSSGGLYLYRPELDVLYWAMAVGPNLIPIGTILHRGEGLSGKILESGEPLIVDNYEQWEGRAAIYDGLPIKSVLGVPVRWGPDGAGQEFLGVLNIVRPYTHRFTRADTELLSMFASQAAIAIHNARLYDTERQARRIAETLQAANLALTQSLDLDTVLETLLDHMARLIPYDSASVYLMETDSRMTIRAMRGYEQWTDPEQIRAITFDINTNPLTRELVTTRRSILIKDTREHPGWENRDGAEHIRSCLHVPLVAGGQVIGSYEVDKAEANFFTEEHLQLAEALAGQAAVAIQNARLYEQVHDSRKQLQHLARQIVTAGEEERRRLSRELHDEAGQDLTALKISLELIQEELPAELESIRQRITEAAAWTTAIMEKIRLLAHDLRPPALDAVGLNATLEDHCRRFAQRMHLPVKYRGQEVPKGLPAAVTISLYRVLQEALTNVARHARAHQAWVTLNCNADTICLSVEDDGQGFDKQAVMSDQSRSSGLGLRGIQERLSSLGGQLEIDTQPGQGTRLVAHVPWRGTA